MAARQYVLRKTEGMEEAGWVALVRTSVIDGKRLPCSGDR